MRNHNKILFMTLCGAAAMTTWGVASAQTMPSTEYEYFKWTECTEGYGGALSWEGFPFDNREQAAKYPTGGLHNVHVHVLKARADVERDGKEAHDKAVRLCAAKIAMFSRPSKKAGFEYLDMSERLRKSVNPTDSGYIIVFDYQDRMIAVSTVQDMRAVGGIYAQYLMSRVNQK